MVGAEEAQNLIKVVDTAQEALEYVQKYSSEH